MPIFVASDTDLIPDPYPDLNPTKKVWIPLDPDSDAQFTVKKTSAA
jgi:hypothetical protein